MGNGVVAETGGSEVVAVVVLVVEATGMSVELVLDEG